MLLENIQKRRKAIGLTQSELSRLSGVSQSTIAKIESNKISPSYQIAKAIFDALDAQEHETSAKAADIMTRKVITIDSNDTVQTAGKIMREKGISQLPVFEKDHLVGIISERIIVENFDKPSLKQKRISEIMSEAPPTIAENAPIKLVSELLKYSSLIAVYHKSEFKGIITKSDLLGVI
ncbi:MAG: CBS domain-containing protein [archaeon]